MKKFSDSHEWIHVQGKEATVGISDFAQDQLGEVVFVQLPKVDDKIRQSEEAAVIESTKAAADIYAPVSGTVTAINQEVIDNPGLLNTSPETEGWLFKIRIEELAELDTLLDHQQYLLLVE